MSVAFPTGIITLLFTDIEGSTELWGKFPDTFHAALDEHNRLMRDCAARWKGVEVKTEGDAFFLVFAKASDAVQFAIDVQRALAGYEWKSDPIRVRIGMHTGEATVAQHPNGQTDYFGPDVNRAARISAAGHGRQILVSFATWQLARAHLPASVGTLDLGVHHLKGLDHPENIHQIVAGDLQREFPPLRTLDALPNNLPRLLTTFVGREREADEVIDYLRKQEIRLLTLLGPGGTGKTRLSVYAAGELLPRFADGVWFVDLSTLVDASQVPLRVAESIPTEIEPDKETVEQIIQWGVNREALLVLDNFEQVVDAAPFVLTLLSNTSRIKVLATSRVRLHISGEQIVSLQPLSLPGTDESFEYIASYDSIILFTERAKLANPKWTLNPINASDVIGICRKLDGMPLAIELAAARMSTMTPREILLRLVRRFELLSSESVGIADRHHTLRNAIDWSYETLSEEEKSVFTRLSVFRGGLFIEAAEAVCGLAALETVSDLHDKSLLQARETLTKMRFEILESIREYAAEKLSNGDEVRAAHAVYFLQQARQQAAELRTANEAMALQIIEVEMDNLRAALQWAKEHKNDSMIAQLALSSSELLRRRGWWQERFTWLQEGLAAAERFRDFDVADLARLQLALGFAHLERGEFTLARPLMESSLATRRSLNDPVGEAECLNRLGNLEYLQGNPDAARTFYEEALLLRQMLGDQDGESAILNNLAVLAIRQGDLSEARTRFEECLRIDREQNNTGAIAHMLSNLGRVTMDLGDLDEAQRLLEESREMNIKIGNRWMLAHVLHNLGDVARRKRDRGAARKFHVDALRIRHELDARGEIPESLLSIGCLLVDEQKWTEAVLILTATETALDARQSPDVESARRELRRVAESQGAERLAKLQEMAGRFTLEQIVDRLLTSG